MLPGDEPLCNTLDGLRALVVAVTVRTVRAQPVAHDHRPAMGMHTHHDRTPVVPHMRSVVLQVVSMAMSILAVMETRWAEPHVHYHALRRHGRNSASEPCEQESDDDAAGKRLHEPISTEVFGASQ